ncbi:MAG TPA: Asp-tRNA(Asn)/Glu-tRNA(Gln) amidotransferase subunit GatA [Thiothrix sp.]|nr:Asp-tRNA(Asn)/Glu-tRNA(Gln) amidotransferase subunit GatA [Thiothrix sp.]
MSQTDSLCSLSLTALQQGLTAGTFSSTELTEHYLARIAKYDPQLNSYLSLTQEQALQQAAAADQTRHNAKKNGQSLSALAGIPYALKDLFCAKDTRTTCASKMLENFTAPYDATVQVKLQQAGGILLGKNNMDEFAMGSSNENSAFGHVHNPWDLEKVPGGSSGGGAACVAARLAPFALGSDTGGSIRQPASFTGITGLKPTYGRVSRYGMIAFASSLDQGGPMTQSAEDAALVLQTIAGVDAKDSTSADQAVPDYSAQLDHSLKGLRIGLPKAFFDDGLDQAVARSIEQAIAVYEKLGATVTDIDLPHANLAVAAYYVIAPAECSSNLSRFDGVRYGHRCDQPENLLDLYERSRWEGFGEEVKRRIMVGTYALSAGYYDAYYIKAQKIRRLIKNDFTEAFKDVDVIMGPAAPTTAFELGSMMDNQVAMYMADLYTIPTSLAGLPSISIPVASAAGMPVGLQIMGNYFDEARLLNIAHQFQQQTDYHTLAPAAFV